MINKTVILKDSIDIREFNWNIFKWLHEQKYKLSRFTLACIAESGNIDILSALHICGFDLTNLSFYIGKSNNLLALKWYKDNNFDISPDIIYNVITDNFELIKWIIDLKIIRSRSSYFILSNNLNLIKFLQEKDLFTLVNASNYVGIINNIEILEWLYQQNIILDHNVYLLDAYFYGHIDVIKYAFQKKVTISNQLKKMIEENVFLS